MLPERLYDAERLVFLDYDKTQAFTNHQWLQPHDSTVYTLALNELIETGGLPAIHCTGRSFPHLYRDIFYQQFSNLPRPHAAQALALLTNVGTEAYEWDTGHGMYMPIDGFINPAAGEFFEKITDALTIAIMKTPHLILQPADHQGRYKLSAMTEDGYQGESNQLWADLMQNVRDQGIDEEEIELTASLQGRPMFDFTPYGHNKQNGIRYMAKRYGKTPEKLCFAGDSLNDLSAMLIEDIHIILHSEVQKELIAKLDEHGVPMNRRFHAQNPYAQGLLEIFERQGLIDSSYQDIVTEIRKSFDPHDLGHVLKEGDSSEIRHAPLYYKRPSSPSFS